MRPFSFMAGIETVMDGKTLADEARRAERMGFGHFVVPDHMIEQLSPIPALATVAAATDRLRIAAFVHDNDLRHPAVLRVPAARTMFMARPTSTRPWLQGCSRSAYRRSCTVRELRAVYCCIRTGLEVSRAQFEVAKSPG